MNENVRRIDYIMNYFRTHQNKDPAVAEQSRISELLPETRGLGRIERISEADLKKDEQERIDYMPFHKRKRNDTDNYEYTKMKENVENKILCENGANATTLVSQEEDGKIKMEVDENYCDEDDSKIYNNPKYNFFGHKNNMELPIFKIKEHIIESLNQTNIVIIQGNTGCGKTTQVPQIILG